MFLCCTDICLAADSNASKGKPSAHGCGGAGEVSQGGSHLTLYLLIRELNT